MKRIILDVETEKLEFLIELLDEFEFVNVITDDLHTKKGMYESIVSLQKGEAVRNMKED